MLLNNGENIIFKEGNVEIINQKRTGTLFLTNQRLFLEKVVIQSKMMGLKKERVERPLAVIPLSHITDIAAEKNLLLKSHKLRVVTGNGIYEFKVTDSAIWAKRTIDAKKGENFGISQSPVQAPITVNVIQQASPTQSVQKEVIEKQIVKIRCRYCGTLVDETVGKCPSCEAKL
ncbi:MAG: hypothetical protein M1161_02515 [Candidatus Thermoplasmatota archaeon]|jgi:hypothetical protein|nr:hypothetical protein [Candidatus Thermoplasmatota archaeon]